MTTLLVESAPAPKGPPASGEASPAAGAGCEGAQAGFWGLKDPKRAVRATGVSCGVLGMEGPMLAKASPQPAGLLRCGSQLQAPWGSHCHTELGIISLCKAGS